ncbi:hypothetical protein G6F43_013028 [Rhizopus delemar]|nr:hypothetical protein G6F43_013028 [Rhizopus delemar]
MPFSTLTASLPRTSYSFGLPRNQRLHQASSILVRHAYTYDHSTSSLRRRPIQGRLPFHNSLLRFFDLLRAGILTEVEEFDQFKRSRPASEAAGDFVYFEASPPNYQVLISPRLPDGILLSTLTTKAYRYRQLPPTYPRFSPQSWRRFWKCAMPHQVRTVLWRIYHKRIPSRERLYRFNPARFLAPTCLVCTQPESDEHFVWSCPLKQAAWNLLSWLTFPSQPIQLQDVMNPPTAASTATVHQSTVDRITVVACMMLSIWRVHWKVVFYDHLFYHGEVVARTGLMLRRIHRENMLSA